MRHFIFAIILGFVSTQAERAIVLEDKSILNGFKRGWEVLTKNLGPILIIWLITIVIGDCSRDHHCSAAFGGYGSIGHCIHR